MHGDEKALITEIIGNAQDDFLAESVMREISCDIEKQDKDYHYSDELIRVIVMSSQEFEGLLRKFIEDNGIQVNFDIWNKTAGRLLPEIEKCGKFNVKQIEILKRIVKLRNWVIHEIYEEEREYNRTHSFGFMGMMIDGREWMEYYRAKLAVTKSMMYEAVDLFNGAANLLRNVSKG